MDAATATITSLACSDVKLLENLFIFFKARANALLGGGPKWELFGWMPGIQD
jgi:hypothetical protein